MARAKGEAMNSWRLAVCMTLSGCAVVSPVIDRDMSHAPNAACATLDRDAALVQAPANCFALAEEDESGRRQAWSGGALAPGRTLIAVLQPGTGCAGTFSHLTLTGASPGPGRAELSVWDLHGRIGHARTATWGSGFARRTLALAGIETTILSPAGARIRVTEGRFDPAQLCFKSY